jgi:hypothetical protein
MYCPRCGQQFLGDVRFCSRCGMSLNVIAAITSRDGLVTAAESNVPFAKRAPRQKGMRVGAMLMLGSLALSPLFFGMCFAIRAGGPLLFPLTGFLIGLAWLLYSYIFADDRVGLDKQNDVYYRPSNTSSSLHRFKVSGGSMRGRTEPASIVEHTTQFFD